MKARIRALRDALRRASPTPILVRLAVAGTGLAALLVALPAEFLDLRAAGVLIVLAVLPALRPRGIMPVILALGVIAVWLVGTAAYGEAVSIWRVLALGSLLYAGHSLAALAACLPYDAEIRSEAVTGWVIRLFAVVIGSAVVLVMALAAVGRLTLGGYAVFAIGGLVAAIAAAGLLARISR
ncbi:hypothetical protein J2S43_007828 [Catenuloplanes nepalensis]|uniref:Uncharacterized protein n=1 Tax=Catenuloplanes nepalensis TaxID=587533 RepID=A0ABT9N6J5_9ACTN|nr:hypothetical protein [Catenuloplanes nepalensis]MDP9799316.1 hypothetical protein [Catenuloplanes nepalensis]